MNLEAFVAHPWACVTVVSLLIVVYLGFVFGGREVLDHFFGWKVADPYINIVGFPIIVFLWMLEKIKEGVTWPWRYRNRRLLKEIFGVRRGSELNFKDFRAAQKKVDSKLGILAGYLKWAFDQQEEARRNHKLIPELEANDRVKERKQAFWLAHGIARKGGYQVKKLYSDYL
ncbi:MAG: hypothetical protein MUP45_02920 [Candidatus Marinimicrobia bacterium]|nr:hypothetical protein [Candidatus Neomarinimicrobiota bacterium]